MSDEKAAEVEGGPMKVKDMDSAESAFVERGRDSGRENRGPSPSLRKAEVGLLLASGEETQLGPAMRRAGYAVSTSEAPKRNGVTVAGAIAAATEAFPSAPTLKTLNARGLQAIDEAFSDPDVPVMAKATLGGSVVKLHAEIGGNDDVTEASRSALYYQRRARLVAVRHRRQEIRYVLSNGVDAALRRLQELYDRTEERFPAHVAALPSRGKPGPLATWEQRR